MDHSWWPDSRFRFPAALLFPGGRFPGACGPLWVLEGAGPSSPQSGTPRGAPCHLSQPVDTLRGTWGLERSGLRQGSLVAVAAGSADSSCAQM